MLDPIFFTSTVEMRQYHALMIESCPLQKPRSTLTNWSIILGDDGAIRMRGLISGHPKFEGVGMVTGPVWQLNIENRLMRTAECWFRLDRGYHEDVPRDIEIEAIGPAGQYVAPCVANRYLEIILEMLQSELAD